MILPALFVLGVLAFGLYSCVRTLPAPTSTPKRGCMDCGRNTMQGICCECLERRR